MVKFGRVLTAMITPFKEDGSVNYAVAEQLAIHLADRGTDSLVLCGTTGESPTMSWDEEYQLFQVVQKAVAGKALVLAGAGSNSTSEAIEATQKAAKLGLDGCLQVVPYYNKPPQEGLYNHFRAIAQSTPELPIMLYNIPGRTGQNMLPETVARLAEIPNIVAVKEASGNLDQASQIRCLTSPEFAIYSGDDSLTLPMLAVGGSGVVSVASHLVGEQLQQMIKAFEAGQVQVATQIHLQLFDLFKALFLTTNPIPVKAALNLQGWDVGSTRGPLCAPPVEVTQKLKDVLSQLAAVSAS
ncbi:MAG: 4-hydroxy-tetrahydrodipicolinate synthase [Microcoleus sp. PH2017_10_PVI_O_A]|uniref:4-hydroxy-tetrahydrodipicolinate synthase n=1 Tax=unclassified Microcoleus TaxID=2642155 RepID=UPI001DFA786A|nr:MULTISPECIES: 4-hydroxy-tetrahydrodipicolinate synthase [unclassified Microcoleus]TAE83471.1 MAG: 4-hydroxy-tetrahydrodipicolinate synthase [Oscillatoriales cyanobacterium]MCC3404502.1 4-hydroxy-tetrahydrodipicolinate synthase [Microcoleus sp. PH2017_10_PVI_O_A]MCC3458570.1 4-hydroxy-tetrahydrodipicolinate synthase [Microcoleus sp. PH2017_11_PCY_U_A]MCC3476820.1 4-hydroxy-tetrahydrodipicolinate synthase [Microcoleus sp. PH2017_12_PCY_D_A]MCC3526958.1 4-hydroxy-tetrahydrodipicolinate synthas